MLGHRNVLIIYFVFLSMCFLQVCISKTLSSGRQKRYTEADVCLEPKKTLKEVNKCPTNEKEFKERSENKNCNPLSTCGGHPLIYHCVRSEGMLVEVCAPRTIITGRCCPIYNEKLGRVIEDYRSLCSKCPFQYTSDQCLNKSECVKPEIKDDPSEQTPINIMSTSTPNVIFGDNNPKQGIEENVDPILIVVIVVPGIVLLVLAITITYHFRDRLRTVYFPQEDGTKNNNDKNSFRESSEPMIKDEACALYRHACDF